MNRETVYYVALELASNVALLGTINICCLALRVTHRFSVNQKKAAVALVFRTLLSFLRQYTAFLDSNLA